MLKSFDFDLIFSLDHKAADGQAFVEPLYEAGFDDAVIGTGQPGTIAISVTRGGPDGDAVLDEAIEAALAALPKGTALREVRPDLVKLEELCCRLLITPESLKAVGLPEAGEDGRYRLSELHARLQAEGGDIAARTSENHAWFAAAPSARRRNSGLAGMADINA